MNLLIANDDGIDAKGIKELARALSRIANIYICAPHTQRSACGHGITVNKPILTREVNFPNAKKAWETSGTPADCVKLGLKLLAEQGVKIHMVCSGINHGGNYGTDTLYSGTVSAAIEGCICGFPALAVSVNDHKPQNFEAACDLAVNTVRAVSGKIGANTVLNINVPNLPPSEVKGVKITKLGDREYDEWFQPKQNEKGETEYWYSGTPVVYENLAEETDVLAMQAGYATITPLHYDLTSHKLIEEVRAWGIKY
jgi:5'-nucleotidase